MVITWVQALVVMFNLAVVLRSRIMLDVAIFRVGAQLGLASMITVEIRIPNRLVGLGE